MALNLADFVLIAVLVGLGCALSYVGLWLMLRQSVAEQQATAQSQLSSLTGTLRTLEARITELSQPVAVSSVIEEEAVTLAAKQAVHPGKEEITPEVLVVIAAAVTAFLGKKVRIRSAKMMRSSHMDVNPWSQQGRALIQASHNLRLRG
ncbi:MAG: hypothetical protein ABSF70_07970 [Terracidiphilus sp.]